MSYIALIDSCTAAWNLLYEYFPIYLLPVDGMKLNHGNLIQNGGRKQWRESSHTCTTPCSLLYVLSSTKEDFSLCPATTQPMRSCNIPVNEKSPKLWTFVLLLWIIVQNSSYQFPPFLYKRVFLSFVLWTCPWFVIVCLTWVVITLFCYSWISSVLLAESLIFFF